jgi:hypothetical protein
MGHYLGFALTWNYLLHNGASKKDRKIKVLESLIGMIEKLSYHRITKT